MGSNQKISFHVAYLHHMAQSADDPDSHRFRRIEISRTATDITGTELDLMQSLPRFLTGNFYQIQGRHTHNMGLGAVLGRFLLQYVQDFLPPVRLGHIDEINNDDATNVAEAQLAGNFYSRLFIDVENRILKSRFSCVLCRMLATSMTVNASVRSNMRLPPDGRGTSRATRLRSCSSR